MIEFTLSTQSDAAPLPMTVIGIGGAGCNVLDTIALEGLPDARLIAMNTDVRALQHAMSGVRVQLGRETMRGIGAGGDPELGREAAHSAEAEIREHVSGQQMVFLCVGLGGGTGSGAAPLVARLAREAGGFVVVFAMMPFSFEGRRRVEQASEALESLRMEADAVVTFDNDRIGELVLPKKGIQEALAAADKIVGQSIRAIINLVSKPGLIRVGMDGLIAALRNEDSRCLFGYGMAGGEDRATVALRQALKSPLIDQGHRLKRSNRVLVHICGGPQLTVLEVQELMLQLGRHLHDEAHVLFGTGIDPLMGDQLSVTILTSIGGSVPAVGRSPELAGPTGGPSIAATQRRQADTEEATRKQAWATMSDEPAPDSAPDFAIEAAIESDSLAADTGITDDAEPEFAEAIPEFEEPETGEPVVAEMVEAGDEYVDESPAEPAEPDASETVPPARTGGFNLRDLAPQRTTSTKPAPAPVGRSTFFQSWRREQERLKSLPPQPPEKVAPVSDFGDTPAPDEPPAPPARRSASRLPTFLDRLRHHGPPPAANEEPQEQATFDESLHPASRGRFEKVDPTIEDGQDLDVPTILRRKPR